MDIRRSKGRFCELITFKIKRPFRKFTTTLFLKYQSSEAFEISYTIFKYQNLLVTRVNAASTQE